MLGSHTHNAPCPSNDRGVQWPTEWERSDRRGRPVQQRVGRRATCGHVVLALARERLVETTLTAGRERCGVGLCLAYWVTQVCNADARDYRRVAKDGWRAGEVVEESNSGAKKYRREVDVVPMVVEDAEFPVIAETTAYINDELKAAALLAGVSEIRAECGVGHSAD